MLFCHVYYETSDFWMIRECNLKNENAKLRAAGTGFEQPKKRFTLLASTVQFSGVDIDRKIKHIDDYRHRTI